jgi:prepilin-type N-terminal cleavage/methylation domain-containing protein
MNQRGFTLIEIMLVVAILTVLGTLAMSAYDGYIAESRIGAAMKDIRQADLILTSLALDGELAAIEPTGYAGTLLNVYQLGNSLAVAASAPTDASAWLDPWGRNYRYQRNLTTNNGVITDSAGTVSNDRARNNRLQSFDLYSEGPTTGDATDDIIRGCDGGYVGTAGGHTC